MTTNDFRSLTAERDRDCAMRLYHSVSIARDACREWIMAEVKELSLEADRLYESASTFQRQRLGLLRDELNQIQTTVETRFSKDESDAFEAARTAVFAHVHEPASRMLAEFVALTEIIEGLKHAREKIEDG